MQTRGGTGTNDLTKREKSALYYEIELSKPWRSFCDRCVEIELENILKETFGDKLGFGLNYKLDVLGNRHNWYKMDFSLTLYADNVESMNMLVDLGFLGKGDDYGGDVLAFDSIKVIASPKNVSIDYEIRSSLCWGHILRGRPDDPCVFKKMMLAGYKRFAKYVEYRFLLMHTKARSAESLTEYAVSQVWEIGERGNLSLSFDH